MALVLLGAGIASACGWFGGFGNASPEEIAQRAETMFQNQADLLGIDVDEMKDAWAEGKNFMEIAEEQGITQEQLQERMREARKEQLQAQLQAMVGNGVITQEQADQRLQIMEQRFENFEGRGCIKGFRGGFGRGFMW